MRKKIEPYIYEIAKGLYFLSGQEEGVVKTVENPNLALRFVPGETTKKKMTSFLIGADSTVNRLPGKFIKLSRARNRFLKSNEQNKLKVKAYNFDEFHNLPIAINKLPLSGNSSILPTVFWAYHCTCGAHYQGIYDRFKYTIPIVKCEDCGKAVEEVTWIDYGKI
ncbi:MULTISPECIES: hypothetical protein [Lactococcus]|uniref:Uncharacterized protein n=2 Tax=Lactococcus TaxID=1357 RepID=A0A9X4SC80_9LACT|nr:MULTISPECIES: hypothetical protein [Lactococcus]PST74025.1 hypothetical protein AEH57_01685 [Lactococcus garvieae]MDG6112248.1 hypothetical protein [Lactococcus formosensis]MDG6114475.1 hypothetical protein [Lactococcus formosensis]MDG6116620.1 hypothetical protein [Lactococcus formosensis]MDG6118405.1 hypothetical protein [Lactococcus formosensis]